MGLIKQVLKDLGLINENDLEVFSTGTRDKDDLAVFRDRNTNIIFVDDFTTKKEVYESGNYRRDLEKFYGKRDFEINHDVSRRVNEYKQFYVGKKILDFGCGEGSFLQQISTYATASIGIEIEKKYIENLNELGIKCEKSLQDLVDETYDTIFCFHTLEHLEDPISVLSEFKKKLAPGGVLVVEVPHSNDFLLHYLKSEEFKKFTLWSQHLVLHTRLSLSRFLKEAGFETFLIDGVQRYGLSNHLNWLVNKEPGGHKTMLSSIETDEIKKSYENALRKIDATDTIVAIVSNT